MRVLQCVVSEAKTKGQTSLVLLVCSPCFRLSVIAALCREANLQSHLLHILCKSFFKQHWNWDSQTRVWCTCQCWKWKHCEKCTVGRWRASFLVSPSYWSENVEHVSSFNISTSGKSSLWPVQTLRSACGEWIVTLFGLKKKEQLGTFLIITIQNWTITFVCVCGGKREREKWNPENKNRHKTNYSH